jgi:hypothetical protein
MSDERRLLTPDGIVLLGAADLVEINGLCKGARRRGTAICTSEAIVMASGAGEYRTQAYRRFCDYIGTFHISEWNDAHTIAEVLAALRGAAISVAGGGKS